MVSIVAVLGLVAGVLTTIAGLGGGMVLQLALSLLYDPRAALAITAPALLAGNVHRATMFRGQIDRNVAFRFAAGALPGSFVGGLVATAVPDGLLRALMVGMTLLAVGRAIGLWKATIPSASMAPAGFVIGALAATSGGAGLLAAPLFLAAGLRGETYVATGAFTAASMHVGRLAAYGAGGLYTSSVLALSFVLAAFILTGNAVGKRLRGRIGPTASTRIELSALVVATALGLAGIGKA